MIAKIRKGFFIIREHGFVNFVQHLIVYISRSLNNIHSSRRNDFIEQRHRDVLENSEIVDGLVEVRQFGFRMKLFADDSGLSRDLLVWGIREEAATEALQRFLTRPMTVFEVGANLGYYVLLELATLPPGSHVYAFEPHPDNCRALRETIRLNDLDHCVTLEQCAVSDRDGAVTLYVEPYSNWHHIDNFRISKSSNAQITLDIPAVRIDSYCKQNSIDEVHLIRMDVEGHELSVLKGAEETISRSKNCILMIEIHTWFLEEELNLSPRDCFEFIKNHGFECYHLSGGHSAPAFNISWPRLLKDWRLITAKHGYNFIFLKGEFS